MADAVKEDAMRLLRAILYKAKDQVGAPRHPSEATVHPSEVAHQVDLIPDTPRCDAAVALLEREGAIKVDEEYSQYTYSGETYAYYKITQRGVTIARSGDWR